MSANQPNMIHFRQHMPGSCDFDPWEADFSSLDELLLDPRILRWKAHAHFDGFVRDSNYIMATFKRGMEWWVVGCVNDPLAINSLPEWRPQQ